MVIGHPVERLGQGHRQECLCSVKPKAVLTVASPPVIPLPAVMLAQAEIQAAVALADLAHHAPWDGPLCTMQCCEVHHSPLSGGNG